MNAHQRWFILGFVLAGLGACQARVELAKTSVPEALQLHNSPDEPRVPEQQPNSPPNLFTSALDRPNSTGGSVASDPLLLRATLSHSSYSVSNPEKLFLRVDLSADSKTPPSRRPLNLALVIDQSGSMAEDQKFTYTILAAHLVVENLSDRDIISVIAFNENAHVLSPAGRAVNKSFLRHRLSEVTPAGWTNLSAGLLEAFAQIDSQNSETQLKHVIILTDGKANRGVTSTGKLRKIVGAARARQIGLSTVGCGTEFDETLLTVLAEAGGGRYTYIRSPEQIPTALATELGGLLEVVAQNVRLKIHAAPNTLIKKVYGRLINTPISDYSISLGDIRDREKSGFLVELTPQRFAEGATAGAAVALTWDNPTSSLRENKQIEVRAAFSTDKGALQESENLGVVLYAHMLASLEIAEEAIQGLDTERFRQVNESFDTLTKEARRYAMEMRDQQLLNHVYLLKHFVFELTAAYQDGLMHDHGDVKHTFDKEVNYRRYLLDHHRPEEWPQTRNKPLDNHP